MNRLHFLQIFVVSWIFLYGSGDKFIDALPVQTNTGTHRLKQSEIDFLLNELHKYNKHFGDTQKSTTNNDDVINHNKRAFVPPLANALSKSDMRALHDELRYLRNKVLHEVKEAKTRRSTKQEMEEKFVPSISVGALANLQDFFETLGQNLETLEDKKVPADQIKFLERDRGLDHHVRKELLDDPGASSPMKPTGSAAFLHAIRNYRPAHKIRSLVALHPEGYFQTNFHDPYYLHAGLGK